MRMSSDRPGFSAEVARRLAKVTYRQLVYWDETGLVRPSIQKAHGKGSRRVYAFEDVVELRVVARLLAIGIHLPAVRRAVRYLARHRSDVARPLAQLALFADGKRILVRAADKRSLVDATAGGQVLITVPVGAIASELTRAVTDLRATREIVLRVRGHRYTAVLTPDLEVGGFTVEVPELPGVITEAETIAAARRNAAEAVELWLETQEQPRPRRRTVR